VGSSDKFSAGDDVVEVGTIRVLVIHVVLRLGCFASGDHRGVC
jgi:hypothetical protein